MSTAFVIFCIFCLTVQVFSTAKIYVGLTERQKSIKGLWIIFWWLCIFAGLAGMHR